MGTAASYLLGGQLAEEFEEFDETKIMQNNDNDNDNDNDNKNNENHTSVKESDRSFDPVDFTKLDGYTKEQLSDHIKLLKPKNLNIPDDFTDKMRDIEIENSNLISMSIELYQKLLNVFGEYKYTVDTTKSKFKKKAFFVKPKFDTETVKKSIGTPIQDISSPLDTSIFQLPPSLVSMKNTDITITEFTESFGTIITKKDMIGISKKMLRDAPNYMKIRFINVCNQILDDLSKVDKISLGKASYVYKAAKHGPTNDINSFRQIVSIPNVVNQFHRILSLRLNNYMQMNKYIDTSIQKGGVSGQKFAIFEQFYKIKNVLKHANKNKKSCAVLFLDLSNAFGNLNLENLYKILGAYGVDKNFIQYIKEFYNKFEYYVDTANIKTDTFKWKEGLIQGCSLSPLLFITALNYILSYIDKEYKATYGYDLGVTKILLTAFVDDICVICKDVASTEIVYKKLSELLKTLGLPINKAKCALMVVNDNTVVTGELTQIQKVNVFKYLGEYVSSDGTCTESYIQFLRGISRKLKMIDVKACPVQDKLKFFEAFVVPWIQRKTMAMYDLSMNNRLKIVSIIKPYIEKWGSSGAVNIFSNVTSILNESKDNIISCVTFEDSDFDEELEQNIEVANYVLKDTNIKIEYGQIDDEFQLDAELAEYDELVDDE